MTIRLESGNVRRNEMLVTLVHDCGLLDAVLVDALMKEINVVYI